MSKVLLGKSDAKLEKPMNGSQIVCDTAAVAWKIVYLIAELLMDGLRSSVYILMRRSGPWRLPRAQEGLQTGLCMTLTLTSLASIVRSSYLS